MDNRTGKSLSILFTYLLVYRGHGKFELKHSDCQKDANECMHCTPPVLEWEYLEVCKQCGYMFKIGPHLKFACRANEEWGDKRNLKREIWCMAFTNGQAPNPLCQLSGPSALIFRGIRSTVEERERLKRKHWEFILDHFLPFWRFFAQLTVKEIMDILLHDIQKT